MKFLLLLLLVFTSLFSQSYEEYLHTQKEAFSSYKDARDKQFSSFLNKEWKAYKASQGLSSYEKEKPSSIPVAKKSKETQVENEIIVQIKPKRIKKDKSLKKIIITPESSVLKTLYFSYFGVDISLPYDLSILFDLKGKVSNKSITKSWNTLAQSEYESVLKELNEISLQLKLNDWGRYLLVKSVALKLYKQENEAKLFSWFMLLKMNYDAHIAFQNHKVILLLPVKNELYNTIYYTLSKRKYYAIDYYAKGELGSIMSYENVYEGADKGLDFSLRTVPLFAVKPVRKKFNFYVNKSKVTVPLVYNKNLLHFFQTYPQVAYTDYFSAEGSSILNRSITESFTPLLKGKSQREALDILLNFVQNAFSYKVDTQQFNREKVMFASETVRTHPIWPPRA